ncbi:MAG: hypothetical protein Edafosvirus19_27, partial [Edafosvirus sp.]
NGMISILDKLIRGSNLNHRDINGRTPLIYSILLSKITIINKLLDSKCDINIKDNLGNTAIMFAIINKRANVIEKLLSMDCDINIIYNGNQDILSLLLSYKCSHVTVKLAIKKYIKNENINFLQNEKLIAYLYDHQMMYMIQELYENKLKEIAYPHYTKKKKYYIKSNEHVMTKCFRKYGDINIIKLVVGYIY